MALGSHVQSQALAITTHGDVLHESFALLQLPVVLARTCPLNVKIIQFSLSQCVQNIFYPRAPCVSN